MPSLYILFQLLTKQYTSVIALDENVQYNYHKTYNSKQFHTVGSIWILTLVVQNLKKYRNILALYIISRR